MRRLHDIVQIIFRLIVLNSFVFIGAVNLRQSQLQFDIIDLRLCQICV